MGEKLLVRALLPATLSTYEFLVPLDLTVAQGAHLMASLLASVVPAAYVASPDVGLMYGEGAGAGEMVAPWETFRSLVLQERLLAGSRVVLV